MKVKGDSRIRSIETEQLLDTKHTIAMKLFTEVEYPFEVLSEIGKYILERGKDLPSARFDKVGEDVWIAKSAKVANTASITGPCIIDEDAEVRHCAFIRGNVIVGKRAVVGNSTELKNSILFDEVQVPHYNYVGDSILGYKAHMGAGSITSNVKSDKTLVEIKYGRQRLATGLKKFGAILGDLCEIGCGTILNPGSVVGRDSTVYPLSSVRGYVPNKSIYKTNISASIVPKTDMED